MIQVKCTGVFEDGETKQALKEVGLKTQSTQKAVNDLQGGCKVTSASAEEQYEALEKYGIDLLPTQAGLIQEEDDDAFMSRDKSKEESNFGHW